MLNEAENKPSKSPSARCPISLTLDLLGDRWSLRVVRDMLLFGRYRYNELLQSCTGISTNILAARLKQLQQQGLVEKFADPADAKSAIYLLTDKGIDLYPVLQELVRWGMTHNADAAVAEAVQEEIEAGRGTLFEQRRDAILSERMRLSAHAEA